MFFGGHSVYAYMKELVVNFTIR